MNNNISIDESSRFEKKVFLPQSKPYLLKRYLRSNGFKKQHDANYVTSIYFDDIHLTNLRDNIDGNPNRTKFRARFYNNQITNVRLELKNKYSYIGNKEVIIVKRDFFNLLELIDFCTRWSRINIMKYVQPTALVSYTREYFVKGSIRATLDFNVTSKRFAGNKLIQGAQHSYGVLEFKYKRNKEFEMRKLYNLLNLPVNRVTKSSKYANALIR